MLEYLHTGQGEELPDPGVQEAGVVNDGDLRVDHLGASDMDHSVCVGAGDVLLLDLFVRLSLAKQSWTLFQDRTSRISINGLENLIF